MLASIVPAAIVHYRNCSPPSVSDSASVFAADSIFQKITIPAIGLVLLLAGYQTGLNAVKVWSILALIYAAAIFIFAGPRLAFLRAALVLTACIVPVPFLPDILAWLQRSAVHAAGLALTPAGVIEGIDGALVRLENGDRMVVAEACSGLKSILVYFTLSVYGSYLFGLRPRVRWALAVLSVPAAWFINVLRLTFVLWIGGTQSSDAAFSAWHSGSGLVFHAAGFISVFALAAGCKRVLRAWVIAVALSLMGASSAFIQNSLAAETSFTDTNAYTVTSRAGRWATETNIFHKNNVAQLPMNLGDWRGKNVPISDTLPYFLRRYRHEKSGIYLYLQPVYGRQEAAFHTAEVCYIDAGWKMDDRGYRLLNLNGKSFPVRYATAQFEDHRHLILYWYAWPSARRVITDGCLMFRVSVEVKNGDPEALTAAEDFISALSRASFGAKPVRNETVPVPDLSAWKTLAARNAGNRAALEPGIIAQRNLALRWLKNQRVPNSIVRRPAYDRRSLILSYRVHPSLQDYRYVFSKSALYDNALAAIAFTMAGARDQASDILSAMELLSNGQGDLFFSFNTHNSWPNAKDSYGAVIRTGASAWAGFAACYYLAQRLMENPNVYADEPDTLRQLRFAERIAESLLKYRVKKPGDLRNGLFRGGDGAYALKLKDGKMIEDFVPGEVAWCSVEHNIDIYFFYRALGRISGNAKWIRIADETLAALVRSAWNPELKQFNRGINALERDSFQALDCASWGACLLESAGETQKARAAAGSIEKYSSKDQGAFGYKPYASGPIYEESAAQKFYYPGAGKGLWEKSELVWPEGTLGAGLAYWRTGNPRAAIEILKNMGEMQDVEGGIPYSTRHIPFQFSTAASAASAAWYVILAEVLRNPVSDALFW